MIFKRIGITSCTSSWKAILDQLGLFWEEVCRPLESYSLVILTDSDHLDLNHYLMEGGAVIDTVGKLTYHITGQRVHNSHCNSLTVIYRGIQEQLDLFTRVKKVEGELTKIYPIENGFIGFWGIPIKILKDKREMRKCFHIPAKRYPAEELSKASKGTVSRMFFDLLLQLHGKRSIPFIHKSFTPTNTSPLLFRIDTDWGTEKSIAEWHKRTKKLNIATTWFLHVEAHAQWLDRFVSMPGDEIALHCFSHIAKPTTAQIDRALKELVKADLKPTGYTAPYGIYNRNNNEHLIKRGCMYGSDFSFLYDSLPLQFSGDLLQIPIYPLCMGSFHFGIQSAHDVKTFFADYINRQLYLGEPIALYDHPEKGNPNLMEEILSLALECGAEPMTFETYAQFWQKRLKSNEVPQFSDLTITNRATVPIRIWSSETSSYLLGQGASCHSDRKGNSLPIPRPQIPYRKLSRFSLRQWKNSFINRHFWRKKR